MTKDIQDNFLTAQECATITNPQNQAAEPFYITQQVCSKEEQHAGEICKGSEGIEGTAVTCPNDYFQLKSSTIKLKNYKNKEGKDKMTSQEMTGSPCQTQTDQYQVLTSNKGSGSCEADMNEQLGNNTKFNLEKNPKTSQEETTITSMDAVRESAKDSEAGPPVRKKRRMGMCGLTEKERSHLFVTQKRENGKNDTEMIMQEICNDTADLVAQKCILSSSLLPSSPQSIPVGSVTQQSDADNRAGTEFSINVPIQNETHALCYPICSAETSCEAESGKVTVEEQSCKPKLQLDNLVEQELKGNSAEIMNRDAESTKDDNNGSIEDDCCPFLPLPFNASQNELAEKKKDLSEAFPLLVHNVIGTVERKEKMKGDAGNTDTMSAGFKCGSVEICEAALTTSEQGNSCEPDVEPAADPIAGNTEHTQTKETADPFGSGNLDYVTDSQLNSVALIEDQLIKGEDDCGSSHCHEDATDLICGLIRELSSLNQKVMATHKELVNLRRGSKTSRKSIH